MHHNLSPSVTATGTLTHTVGNLTQTATVSLLWAPRWCFTLSPTGATVTACRFRRRPYSGAPWTPWVSVTTGLPTTGNSLSIEPDSPASCVETLQVEVTTDVAGTVAYGMAGA